MKAKEFITEMPNVRMGDFNVKEENLPFLIKSVVKNTNYIGKLNNLDMYCEKTNDDITYGGLYNNVPSFYSVSMPSRDVSSAWVQRVVWRDRNNTSIKGIGSVILERLVNDTGFMISDNNQFIGGDHIWFSAFEDISKNNRYHIGAIDTTTKKIYEYDSNKTVTEWFNTFSSYDPTVDKSNFVYYIKKK